MDVWVDWYWRVSGDYVIGTNGNKQLKLSDTPFQIDPELVPPPDWKQRVAFTQNSIVQGPPQLGQKGTSLWYQA